MSDTPDYLKVPCAVCGSPTDLPAVWVCACGKWRLCYRSACLFRIPDCHRIGRCWEKEGRDGEDR